MLPSLGVPGVLVSGEGMDMATAIRTGSNVQVPSYVVQFLYAWTRKGSNKSEDAIYAGAVSLLKMGFAPGCTKRDFLKNLPQLLKVLAAQLEEISEGSKRRLRLVARMRQAA